MACRAGMQCDSDGGIHWRNGGICGRCTSQRGPCPIPGTMPRRSPARKSATSAGQLPRRAMPGALGKFADLWLILGGIVLFVTDVVQAQTTMLTTMLDVTVIDTTSTITPAVTTMTTNLTLTPSDGEKDIDEWVIPLAAVLIGAVFLAVIVVVVLCIKRRIKSTQPPTPVGSTRHQNEHHAHDPEGGASTKPTPTTITGFDVHNHAERPGIEEDLYVNTDYNGNPLPDEPSTPSTDGEDYLYPNPVRVIADETDIYVNESFHEDQPRGDKFLSLQHGRQEHANLGFEPEPDDSKATTMPARTSSIPHHPPPAPPNKTKTKQRYPPKTLPGDPAAAELTRGRLQTPSDSKGESRFRAEPNEGPSALQTPSKTPRKPQKKGTAPVQFTKELTKVLAGGKKPVQSKKKETPKTRHIDAHENVWGNVRVSGHEDWGGDYEVMTPGPHTPKHGIAHEETDSHPQPFFSFNGPSGTGTVVEEAGEVYEMMHPASTESRDTLGRRPPQPLPKGQPASVEQPDATSRQPDYGEDYEILGVGPLSQDHLPTDSKQTVQSTPWSAHSGSDRKPIPLPSMTSSSRIDTTMDYGGEYDDLAAPPKQPPAKRPPVALKPMVAKKPGSKNVGEDYTNTSNESPLNSARRPPPPIPSKKLPRSEPIYQNQPVGLPGKTPPQAVKDGYGRIVTGDKP